MTSGSAPTGKWETIPPHLGEEGEVDPARMNARLHVRRPGVPEVEIPVDKSEFLIGRLAAEVDLVLDDDLVSRKHAQLTMDSRGYFRLQDLGSRNGIKFKGRTTRRLNLIDGDEFSIGRADFTFRAEMTRFDEESAEAEPRSDSTEEPPIPAPAESASLEPPRRE